jgi:hypothetical protein
MALYRAEIYPAYNARYYAHLAVALEEVVGAGSFRYTLNQFPRLGPDCFAFRVVGPGISRNFYIHAQDPPEIDPVGLGWCDIFGKVNLPIGSVVPKVVPIGPTFPFRASSHTRAFLRGLRTYWLGRGHTHPFRRHLNNHRGQAVTRFDEHDYRPAECRPNYVFFNASVWEGEDEGNAARARFVEACRTTPGVEFEGGLFPRDARGPGQEPWAAAEWGQYLGPRYSAAENLRRSRESVLTMNNPSSMNCHSWRFAEQLALGKAIVSTPLRREVPVPLVHGKHLHFVDGSTESFRAAIALIAGDDEYRRLLERNARAYYDAYLAPKSALVRLMRAGGIDHADLGGSAGIDAPSHRAA